MFAEGRECREHLEDACYGRGCCIRERIRVVGHARARGRLQDVVACLLSPSSMPVGAGLDAYYRTYMVYNLTKGSGR